MVTLFDLPDKKFLGFFSLIMIFTIPGLTLLYLSNPSLFNTIHWISLLLLGAIYSAPIFLFYLFVRLFFDEIKIFRISLPKLWFGIFISEIVFLGLFVGIANFSKVKIEVNLISLYNLLFIAIVTSFVMGIIEKIKKKIKQNKKIKK